MKVCLVIATYTGSSCDTAIDLSNVTSPYIGNTSLSTNFLTSQPSCTTSTAPELVFKHLVPSGYNITLQQTYNGYDSAIDLRYGGTCPGTTAVTCQDDEDLDQVFWVNTLGYDEWVYYVQSGYGSEAGQFALTWNVTVAGM